MILKNFTECLLRSSESLNWSLSNKKSAWVKNLERLNSNTVFQTVISKVKSSTLKNIKNEEIPGFTNCTHIVAYNF